PQTTAPSAQAGRSFSRVLASSSHRGGTVPHSFRLLGLFSIIHLSSYLTYALSDSSISLEILAI
ncbi:MAG: hypothetical protein ORN98_08170, partial [Alphaproteobacteria bacterium]|nr:hypothetical protein [Alphaproteobacteria bacterium]